MQNIGLTLNRPEPERFRAGSGFKEWGWGKESLVPFFILSLFIWMFAFRGFLSGKLSLVSDAHAYFEHFKFFLDQIQRGVYPFWEPTRDYGQPIEFFLRRIGSFNPFILLPLLFNKLGMPYPQAYLVFLALYYFLGMIGFYFLAERVLRDRRMAFLAYLLLMFSSLGTRMFDSYILLTVIPMIWFFYFFVRFSELRKEDHRQDKRSGRFAFLGMTFTLMLLFSTYIPFYFLTIFKSFLICCAIFYFKEFKDTFLKYAVFAKQNPIFVTLCVSAFLASLIPGILFFHEAQSGEISLADRHYYSTSSNEMEVDIKTVTQWGMEEDLKYSLVFQDLRKFKFAILYVPAFAFIILVLGAFVRLTKKTAFFFVWGLSIFIIFSHHGPIYSFLRDHIFYFKYFRNLHFFLWMGILPISILFLVEQLRLFLEYLPSSRKKKITFLLYVICVHAAFLIMFILNGSAIPTTYAVISLSCIFFLFHIFGLLETGFRTGAAIIFLIVVIQPLEVYSYLSRNSKPAAKFYRYKNSSYLNFADTEDNAAQLDPALLNLETFVQNKDPVMYYGVKWLTPLIDNIDKRVFGFYVNKRFIAYDHVEWMEDDNLDLERIGKTFVENKNLAFVFPGFFGKKAGEEKFLERFEGNPGGTDPQAQVVVIRNRRSKQIDILDFDNNFVKIKTRFDSPKFLVYNDAYYSKWRVEVDGRETPLFRANVGFKGWVVPAGESISYLSIGSRGVYGRNFMLHILFMVIFTSLVVLAFRSRKSTEYIESKS